MESREMDDGMKGEKREKGRREKGWKGREIHGGRERGGTEEERRESM